MDSDLGGPDGFIELTNIECYTLRGDPDFVQFNMISSTENDFVSEVYFSRGW